MKRRDFLKNTGLSTAFLSLPFMAKAKNEEQETTQTNSWLVKHATGEVGELLMLYFSEPILLEPESSYDIGADKAIPTGIIAERNYNMAKVGSPGIYHYEVSAKFSHAKDNLQNKPYIGLDNKSALYPATKEQRKVGNTIFEWNGLTWEKLRAATKDDTKAVNYRKNTPIDNIPLVQVTIHEPNYTGPTHKEVGGAEFRRNPNYRHKRRTVTSMVNPKTLNKGGVEIGLQGYDRFDTKDAHVTIQALNPTKKPIHLKEVMVRLMPLAEKVYYTQYNETDIVLNRSKYVDYNLARATAKGEFRPSV